MLKMTTDGVWNFIKPFEIAKLDKLGVEYIIERTLSYKIKEYFKVIVLFESNKSIEFQGDWNSTFLYGGRLEGKKGLTISDLTKEMIL